MIYHKPDSSFASTVLTKSNFKGDSLLGQVNGRTRRKTRKNYNVDSDEGEEGAHDANKAAPAKTEEVVNNTKAEYEPATDDEPLSSSDESDRSAIEAMAALSHSFERAPTSPKAKHSDVNTDPIETKGPQQTTNKQGKGKGASKKLQWEGTRKSSRHGNAQKASLKRTAPEMMSSGGVGDDDEDDELLFSTFSSQQTKRGKFTYGSSASASIRGRINIHTSEPSSPDVLNSSPKQGDSSFKKPGDLPPPPPKQDTKDEGKFVVPQTLDIPNPHAKIPPPTKLKHGFGEIKDSKFHMPPSALDDGDVPIHSSQANGSAPEFKHPASLPNDSISSSSLTTSSSKNPPVFDFSLDDGDDSPLSPLSSVGSSCSHDLSQEEKAFLASDCGKPPQTECPMCGVSIDAEFLKEFANGRRLNVRLQNQFCRSHRKRSAELEWVKKGYPDIDWETFPTRVRGHFPALEKVMVVGEQSKSFFRNSLASSIKSGKEKTRLTIEGDSMEMMSSGYYGSKGSRKM